MQVQGVSHQSSHDQHSVQRALIRTCKHGNEDGNDTGNEDTNVNDTTVNDENQKCEEEQGNY